MGKTWELVFFTRAIKSLPVKYHTHPAKTKGPDPRVLFTFTACANPLSLHLSFSSSFLRHSTGISNPSVWWGRGSFCGDCQGQWVCERGWHAVPIEPPACQFVHMPACVFRAFSSTSLDWSPSCALKVEGMKTTQVLARFACSLSIKARLIFLTLRSSWVNKIFGGTELMIDKGVAGIIF